MAAWYLRAAPPMLLSLAAIALLAQSKGTLDVSEHVEMRARATQGQTPNPGFDVANTAGARMVVTDRRWEIALRYGANVTAPDIETTFDPLLLHLGDAAIGWHDRRVRLTLTESGTYGQQNAALLQLGGTSPDGKPLPVQALAAPTTIHYASTRTNGAAEVRIDRRWTTRISGEYFLTGGIDAASRATMPLIRGPRADALLSYRVDRTDWLDTRANGFLSTSEASPCGVTIRDVTVTALCSPEVETGAVTESWRHAVSRHTELSAGAGASVLRVRLRPDLKFASFLVLTGQAAADYHAGLEGQRVFVHGEIGFAPMLDYVSALADNRIQASVQVGLPSGRTRFSALVGAVRSVQSAQLQVQPLTLVRGESTLDFALEKWVSVGIGARLAWQDQAPLGAYYSVAGYGYVTLNVPTLRF